MNSINHADGHGVTPLIRWASLSGNVDNVVTACPRILSLIEQGAAVDHRDNNGRTALFQASLNGSVAAIKALGRHASIDLGDNRGRTPLFIASLYGRLGVITALLTYRANVDLPSRTGKTPLFAACSGGHVVAVDALVRYGANVNHIDNHGKTSLMYASTVGKTKIIATLITAGANIDQIDIFGQTALFQASEHGNVEVIDKLLANGANIGQIDNQGKTVLFGASEFGSVEAIDVLVGAGADLDHSDHEGQTALFSAANGNYRAVSALLEFGANVNHSDPQGQTALSFCLRLHFPNYSSVQVLLTAGANENNLDNQGRTTLDLFRSEHDFPRPLVGIPVFLTLDTTLTTEATMSDFSRSYLRLRQISKTKMLQNSVSLTDFIIDIVDRLSPLGKSFPFNISLDTFSDDGQMGMFFRYGYNTVVSISPIGVNYLTASAPICTGDGRVIYTKKVTGRRVVYENHISLNIATERALCHNLSGRNEKNWGCFGRLRGEFFIVYSVIPLRIFKVDRYNDCSELPAVQLGHAYNNPPGRIKVKKEYPNFEAIEKMYTDARDENGTGIFRGGTRGIEFGGEYLFVGHVTLHKRHCFPNWFTERNGTLTGSRMYFMYFYTVRLVSGIFQISRISSCFQPPSHFSFHKIIFPCGIAHRIAHRKTDIVVSFGRDDKDCLVTSYTTAMVNNMLVPVHSWNENNYVFHPNYASSLRSANVSPMRSMLRNIYPTGRVGLIGTSPDSHGKFNPAITNFGTQGNNFMTAWRKLNGSVQDWIGYNQVAMESCTLKIKRGKLVYRRESETVEFLAGRRNTGGEDPRLITENDCALLLVNDLSDDGDRRMYVHNLATDDSAMTTHPFCHNISNGTEKNWGPFYANDQLLFVYTVDPLKVGTVGERFQCPRQNSPTNIECELISSAETPVNLQNIFEANGLQMRGGTPGLLFAENEYLFVGHAVQERRSSCFPDFAVQRSVDARDEPRWHKVYSKLYTAFLYTIGKDTAGSWEIKRISCCSHFPGKRENFTKIHFPAGLAKASLGGEFEDAFIVSFGEKDMYGGFCAINRNFLNYVLRPVTDWNVHNYVVDINLFQNVANIDPEFHNNP